MKHETVLLEASIEHLNIKPDGIYVDATLGGGGHSEAILKILSTHGKLFVFDQDQFAIDFAKERLKAYQNVTFIKSNFKHLKIELQKQNIHHVDGILFDLGLSSFQIDDTNRGFSYMKDVDLDMRMDQSQPIKAADILNTYEEDAISELLFKYGEEKNARRIAKEIIKQRPLKTTHDLVKITDRINYDQKGHSAKRVFQALRIAVNDELSVLEDVLAQSVSLLKPEGRLVVITFHSLEDRIVKHFFKTQTEVYVPKDLPIIQLPKPACRLITRKPVYPDDKELNFNSRSRSAKLRAIEKENV